MPLLAPPSTFLEAMMARAEEMAERATCPTAQVGAVLIALSGDIVTGYNGAPPGIATCFEAGCVVIPATDSHREYSRHLHAEGDVLTSCARHGIATHGATLFVSLPPCLDCSRLICNSGVRVVVIRWAPPGWWMDIGRYLNQGGVEIKEIDYETDVE